MESGSQKYFHLGEVRDYDIRARKKAVINGEISQGDVDLIDQYISEKQAVDQIGRHRVLKINTILLGWQKHFLNVEFPKLTMPILYSAIQKLGTTISHTGKPFAQNTQHDFVVILKPFLIWMIENKINPYLDEKKIRSIKNPTSNNDVTHPEDILDPEEIRNMIKMCHSSRDRALIAVQYEAATRIGEIGRMEWRDVVFDDYGAKIRINDTKTKKTRFARITNESSARYLATWRDDYPGNPEGEAPIFLSERGGSLTYYAIRKIFQTAAKEAGIKKEINTHLFRKSRGTHLIEQGLPIANVIEMMWGNQGTKMIETYIHLSPVEQDRVMLKHAGLLTDEENKRQERRLAGAMCPHCHTQNSPTARYCVNCGKGLTQEAANEEDYIKNRILANKELLMEILLEDTK